MDRTSSPITAAGVTLIELMVVLLILAISLALGTPLMQGLRYNNQVRFDSNRFLTAVNLARSQAVMRNTTVSICPSAMAETGEEKCSGTYANGWIVFSNEDRDRVVAPGSDEVLGVFHTLPKGFSVSNSAGTRLAFELINYLPDGTSRSNRTLKFCPPAGVKAQALSVVINIVGRARLARAAGLCPVV